jgi:hypothetical protein
MDQTPPPYQPDPAVQLQRTLYYQLIHTLCALLPPPLADTPEALLARNQAAMAKVAALLPVNADEADLAAHCVCARGQAEDVMRLTRAHATDIHLVMRLNGQYALMERTAVSIRAQLLRVQTARHKREKDEAACNQDAWAEHIALGLMTQAMAHTAPAPAAEQAPEPAHVAEPLPPSPARVAAQASQPSPAPVAAPLRAEPAPPSAPKPADDGEPPFDPAAEAERYAILYPRRARLIRSLGGLPDDCDFGPPEPELVHAIVAGTSPALRALDGPAAA